MSAVPDEPVKHAVPSSLAGEDAAGGKGEARQGRVAVGFSSKSIPLQPSGQLPPQAGAAKAELIGAESTAALQRAFAAHVRDPQHAPAPADVAPRRMAVYAELCFNNIASLLAANFPVIRTLYDDGAWRALVRAFYREHRAQTPLFTQIACEFIAYLEQRAARGAGDPPFLVELAHYEWSELALGLDEQDLADCTHDAHGDVLAGVPVVSPLARVLAYRFPVHRIGPEFRPAAPGAQPTLILLVRGRDDAVRFLEIDALTALLIERLQANRERSGLACLDALLHEVGRGGEAALRESGITILRRLREREALLGTRRTSGATPSPPNPPLEGEG